ncbi:MAG: hypothetical protein ABSF62_14500 [Bryobacteraceae bacterium]
MLALLAFAGAPLYSPTAVKLRVDATDAPRRLFHVRMTMAANAGPNARATIRASQAAPLVGGTRAAEDGSHFSEHHSYLVDGVFGV